MHLFCILLRDESNQINCSDLTVSRRLRNRTQVTKPYLRCGKQQTLLHPEASKRLRVVSGPCRVVVVVIIIIMLFAAYPKSLPNYERNTASLVHWVPSGKYGKIRDVQNPRANKQCHEDIPRWSHATVLVKNDARATRV